nr:MAG: wsv216-like protein [Metapenaeopsis lamellata majanivirus]
MVLVEYILNEKMLIIFFIITMVVITLMYLLQSKNYNNNNNNNNSIVTHDPNFNNFIEGQISYIVGDLKDRDHANYLSTKIRTRLWDDDDDDDDDEIHHSHNNNNNKHSLYIKEISIRLCEKGINDNTVRIAALYFIKAKVLHGKFPIRLRIKFYETNSDSIICSLDTIIESLGKPIMLKEISNHLNHGQEYRVCIESDITSSSSLVLYDGIVHIHSPFPELIPILICRDTVLLKYINRYTSSIHNLIDYTPKLFTLHYLTQYPQLLPTLTKTFNQSNNFEPTPGNISGHCLLSIDPFQGSQPLSNGIINDNSINADLSILRNPANPIECFILLRNNSIEKNDEYHPEIKGWIINYKSTDGTEYRQIFSLSAAIDKYSSKSMIDIKTKERLADLKIQDSVTVWNTHDIIGIEKNNDTALTTTTTTTTTTNTTNNKKQNFPIDESFFQSDPYIVLDKVTGECVMLTLGIDNVLLNPRWAPSPCHVTSRDRLIVLNPKRKHHFSPHVSNLLIFKGLPGGHSFTRKQESIANHSSIIARFENSKSLNLPVVSLPNGKDASLHFRHEELENCNYSIIDVFPRSLPIEIPLNYRGPLSHYPIVVYTKKPSKYSNNSYSHIRNILEKNPYEIIAKFIVGDKSNYILEKKQCTIFAIGFTKTISNLAVEMIYTSLIGTVSIVDTNGLCVASSDKIIVGNNGILIISNNIDINSSLQRWSNFIPFSLGPCKKSGQCGILGNWLPLYTVDKIVKICKVFRFRVFQNSNDVSFTIYLDSASINNSVAPCSDMLSMVALYLSPVVQGKRCILNIAHVNTKVCIIPSKRSIGRGAESATSIIILDRIIYALMSEIKFTNLDREKDHFAKFGFFTPGSAYLDEHFAEKHIDITQFEN